MHYQRKNLIISLVALLGGLVLASAVFAGQIDLGLNEVGAEIQLGGDDPRVIIARVIRAGLTLLGVIAVILVLYGGFLWMSAGGDSEKIVSARRMLINAGIGLVIVLSAWSIATFVLNRLLEATGAVPTATGRPPGAGPGGIGSTRFGFRILQISPRGEGPFPRNAIVLIRANRNIDSGTVCGNVHIQSAGASGDMPCAPSAGAAGSFDTPLGRLEVSGSRMVFRASGSCNPQSPANECFPANSSFDVRVDEGGLRSADAPFDSLNCSAGLGADSPCRASFFVGNYIDTEDPEIELYQPESGETLIAGRLRTLLARATDDSFVQGVRFLQINGFENEIGAVPPPPENYTPAPEFDAEFFNWTVPADIGTCTFIGSEASDVAGRVSRSEIARAAIRPASCGNGIQDGRETGIDCGGVPDSADYCGACSGEACAENPSTCTELRALCRSGACSNGICQDRPRIDRVEPAPPGSGRASAAPGSFVTITGEFFGDSPGQVFFLGDTAIRGDDVEAQLAPCANSWSRNQIIVLVPSGLSAEGPVSVVTAEGTDRTDDDRGWVGIFDPGGPLLPQLCGVIPNSAGVGEQVRLVGNGFGAVSGSVTFQRGSAPAVGSAVDAWTDSEVTARVPDIESGESMARISVSGVSSAPVRFTVLPPEAGTEPIISSVSPSSGSPGTYLTISGANFGSQPGLVRFVNPSDSAFWANGDADFPAACEIAWWRPDQIIVKVPEKYSGIDAALPESNVAAGGHLLTVERVGASPAASASVNFEITDGAPGPGVCAIDPVSGPVNTAVRLFGEAFRPASDIFVRFFENNIVNPSAVGRDRDADYANARVPAGARTGPVTVELSAPPDGFEPNSVNFQVFDCREAPGSCAGFGDSYQCCPNGTCSTNCAAQAGVGAYGWYFSTGPIPRTPRLIFECGENLDGSPSPWDGRSGGENACVNAEISGRFNMRMQAGSLSPETVRLFQCEDRDCENPAPVTGSTISANLWGVEGRAPGTQFHLMPPALLADAWYRVELSSSIRASEFGNQNLREDPSCGEDIAYCWTFKTRQADSARGGFCEAGAINVNPAHYTAETSSSIPYSASVVSSDDACILLNPSALGFSWSASGPQASVAARSPAFLADVLPQSETAAGSPVRITSQTSGISDFGELVIDFLDPEAVEYTPNCRVACVNAAIVVRFNTAMDFASITEPGAVGIQRCGNESCTFTREIIEISSSNLELGSYVDEFDEAHPNRVLRISHPNFMPREFYRVTLSGSIESAEDAPLRNKHGSEFSWIFRTGDQAGPCGVDGVEIEPVSAISGVIGWPGRVAYRAIPRGVLDECSPTGQELIARDYDWDWSVEDPRIAGLLREGEIDTTLRLPRGCSLQCLNTGSAGAAGALAVCGNSSNTSCNTDADCTRAGEICSAFGQCIEARLGEECDDGNSTSGDGCSSHCLNEGSTLNGSIQGAVCGNGGICTPGVAGVCGDGEVCSAQGFCVEYGEDCDDGNTVSGDGCSAECLNEGANAGRGVLCDGAGIGIGEDCDDGSPGCSGACLRTGSRPGPLSVCGNNIAEDGEDCDDGNTVSGDGCSRICLNEGSPPSPNSSIQGAVCGNGGICTPGVAGVCGDGEVCSAQGFCVEYGEDCDDGNTVSGDGCSAICLNEGSSWRYENASFCGDGIIGAGEDCDAASAGGDGRIDPVQIAEGVSDPSAPFNEDNQKITEVLAMESVSAVFGGGEFILQGGTGNDAGCMIDGESRPDICGEGDDGAYHLRPNVTAVSPARDERNVCRNPMIRVEFDQLMRLSSFQGNVVIAGESSAGSCGEGEILAPRTQGAFLWLSPLEGDGWGGAAWSRFKEFLRPRIPTVFAAHSKPADSGWCSGEVRADIRGVHSADGDTTTAFIELRDVLDRNEWYRVRIEGDAPGSSDRVDGVRAETGVGMNGDYEWEFHTGADVCEVDEARLIDSSRDPSVFTVAGEEHTFTAEALSNRGALGLVPISPVSGVYDWQWRNWTSSNAEILSFSNTDEESALVLAAGRNGDATVSVELEITADQINSAAASTVGRTFRGAANSTVFICENPWPGVRGPSDLRPLVDGEESADGREIGVNFDLGEPYGNFTTRYCRDSGAHGVSDDLPNFTVREIIQPPPGVLKEFVLRSEDSNDVIGFRMLANTSHLSPLAWYMSHFRGGAPAETEVDGFRAVRDGRTVYISAANIAGSPQSIYSNIYVVSYNEGAEAGTREVFEQLLSNLRFGSNMRPSDTANVCETSEGVVNDERGDTILCTADIECIAAAGRGAFCRADRDKIRRDLRRLEDLREIESSLRDTRERTGAFPALSGGTFVRGYSATVWPSWTETLSQNVGGFLPQDPINQMTACTEDEFATGTCYNAVNNTFQCPLGSRVYLYRNDGPDTYILGTDLEYTARQWEPELKARPSPYEVRLIAGSPDPAVCVDSVLGSSNLCGDGIVDPLRGEICERGETRNVACGEAGVAGTGTISAVCGTNCRGWIAAPGAVCVSAFCGDGVVQAGRGEVCDDGAQNGRYGFCRADCSGRGAYCGDGTIGGPEACDRGAENGDWELLRGNSCAWDCSFPGPHCGDGVVQAGHEACDGDTLVARSVCSGGTRICDADADCPSGETCNSFEDPHPTSVAGVSASTIGAAEGVCPAAFLCAVSGVGIDEQESCPAGVSEGQRCPGGGICTRYETSRSQGCSVFCQRTVRGSTGITACRPLGFCGNGVVEGGEECDDGNTSNNDACTNECRANICGDGFRWNEVEECDLGAENGQPCSAAYGQTCNFCAANCRRATSQGAFCGDGAHTPGAERCDYTADPIIRADADPPEDYIDGFSLCSMSCNAVCPPEYSRNTILFRADPRPSTRAEFDPNVPVDIRIPACRAGGGFAVDVDVGRDVLSFPSPLAVLFVVDNSGSLNSSQLRSIRDAVNNAVERLLGSREPGDIKVGILEFGGTSILRTHNQASNAAVRTQSEVTETGETSNNERCGNHNVSPPVPMAAPCYDSSMYPAPPSAGSNAFLTANTSNWQGRVGNIMNAMQGENLGTKSWLAFRHANAVLAREQAASKVVIFMSDGYSTDCCSYSRNLDRCGSRFEEQEGYCSVSGGQCRPPGGQADCQYSHSEAEDLRDSGVTVFTASFPIRIPPMEQWATQSSGTFSYAYTGGNIVVLFNTIVDALDIEILIQVRDLVTGAITRARASVEGDELNLPIEIPNLTSSGNRNICRDNAQDSASVSVDYEQVGPSDRSESKVTLSNLRMLFCPLQGF